MDAVAVSVDPRVVTKILHSESGHNTIFDLNVEGAALVKAMIVDWQHEPIKGKLLHIDFKRIAMDKAMRVSVPVQLDGRSRGRASTGGGILDQIHARGRDRVPAGRYSGPPGRRCLRTSSSTAPSTSPTCRTPAPLSSSATSSALVAHVTLIKEEVAADVAAPDSRTEPEVAKKGKGDAAHCCCSGGRCQGSTEEEVEVQW